MVGRGEERRRVEERRQLVRVKGERRRERGASGCRRVRAHTGEITYFTL